MYDGKISGFYLNRQNKASEEQQEFGNKQKREYLKVSQGSESIQDCRILSITLRLNSMGE
uniref:Uncharacterized protein n=1 Tax=Arundo donax TaxID=35708 RepID=A0A0A9F105_ARUDO